jgi:Putative 2OG-Fe(II) oxygenase
MPTSWWDGQKPKTKFAPNFRVPLYYAKDGGKDMIEALKKYCIEMEQTIIADEQLVSEVPKNTDDPYKYTQQWKQHHLIDDSITRKGGDAFKKFPPIPETKDFFDMIRSHYLLHLKNLGYPRRRVFIHCWANVLRKGEHISRHMHLSDEFSYLSGTYYLTDSRADLKLQNPIRIEQLSVFPNTIGNLILFPSWLPHWSDPYDGPEERVSIAFDLVAEENARANPWRPHQLFDDPDTMPGFDE